MNSPLAGSRPAEILVVEDNEDDVELMRISFRRSTLNVSTMVTTSG